IAAHKGIMHLDLKPANVLFKHTDTGITVKIIDFGLSKIAISLSQEAQSHQTAHTQFGKSIISGTWDYAPPEQLGLGIPSAKSDIYAFGATLYRLMTLESPRHLNPRRLSQSPKLFELLCDCKEENPDNRPDIDTVVNQLLALLEVKTSKKTSKKTNKTLKTGDIIRDRLKDNSEGPEMVIIPAGRFKMGDIQGIGDSNEQPVHTVTLDGFAIGRYTVTFAEYDKFVEATNGSKLTDYGWGRDNRPVINVNWNDATAYVLWLSEQTGQTYRLPTEAEWEYAAKAGTETNYWWGNKIGKNLCNCSDSESQWSGKKTAPVGSFEANPWGLYDTVGNVWEWVQDWYSGSYYSLRPLNENNPTGSNTTRSQVRRGGGWNNGLNSVRSASRGMYTPRNHHYDYLGFRLVRNYP
ncbi:MAG: SUMF1/EgtB/PvdO family nonheme iron enzyme, partial [Thiomargarita sp.]|nr:SUMF1/EgtB/PvdO family nonheme iron enzyme [Thiomargarita sp.]